MSCRFVCDGCGKEAPAEHARNNPAAGWLKPREWYQRMDEDGTQDACCRECIEKIAAKTGKSSCVLPV